MDKKHIEFIENYRNTITLRHDQSWQIDYLIRQEIRRLEKVIAKRKEQGKDTKYTFENTLAFNKRLLKHINHQFHKG